MDTTAKTIEKCVGLHTLGRTHELHEATENNKKKPNQIYNKYKDLERFQAFSQLIWK